MLRPKLFGQIRILRSVVKPYGNAVSHTSAVISIRSHPVGSDSVLISRDAKSEFSGVKWEGNYWPNECELPTGSGEAYFLLWKCHCGLKYHRLAKAIHKRGELVTIPPRRANVSYLVSVRASRSEWWWISTCDHKCSHDLCLSTD